MFTNLPDHNGNIFAASLLISYRSFFIFNLVIYCHDFTLCKMFFPKRKGLSDDRVVLLTKKEHQTNEYQKND